MPNGWRTSLREIRCASAIGRHSPTPEAAHSRPDQGSTTTRLRFTPAKHYIMCATTRPGRQKRSRSLSPEVNGEGQGEYLIRVAWRKILASFTNLSPSPLQISFGKNNILPRHSGEKFFPDCGSRSRLRASRQKTRRLAIRFTHFNSKL